jgi:hypothetical protein
MHRYVAPLTVWHAPLCGASHRVACPVMWRHSLYSGHRYAVPLTKWHIRLHNGTLRVTGHGACRTAALIMTPVAWHKAALIMLSVQRYAVPIAPWHARLNDATHHAYCAPL